MTDYDDLTVFTETPHPSERHPVNYLRQMGAAAKRWRMGLPHAKRSHSAVSERVQHYVGGSVNRQRIARLEQGDHTVSLGLMTAMWAEMGVLPEVAMVGYTASYSNLAFLQELDAELDTVRAASLNAARAELASINQAEADAFS